MKISESITAFSKSRWSAAWVSGLLGVITILVFLPIIHCGFISFDDEDYVTDNARVLAGLNWQNVGWAFTTNHAGNWHPLTWLSLMLDVNLFGRQAAGFHLTNLALHAVNVVLLFWVMRALTGPLWRSALVAALFGWHPLAVESVAWVAERKSVLSTGFGFLALLFYIRYTRREAGAVRSSDYGFLTVPAYWLAAGCLALGLMCKAMLVTWPFLLLVLDFWPLERGKTIGWRRLVLEKIPFLALALAASVVTFRIQQHGGAVTGMTGLTPEMRLGNALVSYVAYLGMLGWPAGLAIFYPHPGEWPLENVLAAAAALAAVTWWAWRMRGSQPWLLTGWLWYVGTLVPVIGLVQVGAQSMADRYTYIPLVGLLVMIVWGAAELGRHRPFRVAGWSLAAGVAIAACLVLTRRQLGYWQDGESLFREALAVTKDNALARNCLGVALYQKGDLAGAANEYQQAVNLNPHFSDAYYNLGLLLDKQGQTDAAVSEFQQALQYKPNRLDAGNQLAADLFKKGETGPAIEQYQKTLELNPNSADVRNNLGAALDKAGQTDAAIAQYQQALRLKPDDADACNNLGIALGKQGRTDEAIGQYQQALRLKPDFASARNNLGGALYKQGRLDEAADQYQQALQLIPGSAEIHNNLAMVRVRQGRFDEAIQEYEQSLQVATEDVQTGYNLGAALDHLGRLDEAIRQYQQLLGRHPDCAPARQNLAGDLEQKGEAGAALREYQSLARLEPDSAVAHNSLGRCFAELGRFDEAAGEFQQALRRDPKSAEANNNLGYLWTDQGEHLEAALALIQNARKADPKNASYLDSQGWVLLKLNRPAEGVDYLRQAIRQSPRPDPSIYDHLGDTYAALNQPDQAREAWRQSLALAANPQVQKKLEGGPAEAAGKK